jgi:hypothetical protein
MRFRLALRARDRRFALRFIVARLIAVGTGAAECGTIAAFAVTGDGRRSNAGKKQDKHQLTHGPSLSARRLLPANRALSQMSRRLTVSLAVFAKAGGNWHCRGNGRHSIIHRRGRHSCCR